MKTLILVLGGLALAAAGCHTVEPVGYPAEYIAEHGPSHVWVTTGDGSSVELWNPEMHGDTLSGFSVGDYREVPLSDVRLVRASFLAPGRTAALVSIATIGTALIVSKATSGKTGTSTVCLTPGTDFLVVCGDHSNGN